MQPLVQAKEFFAAREEFRRDFVRDHVGEEFDLIPQGQDWASRRYLRVRTPDETFILMEAVPDHIPTATMGHKLSAFIKINEFLHRHGIHAPEIIAEDGYEGYVLLEDLGDTTVHAAMERGGDEMALYGAATDILISMRDKLGASNSLDLPRYEDSYINKGRQRIVDWYIPATRQAVNPDELLPSYLAAWDEITAQLPPPPIGFIHGDYHMQNLMLLPDGSCGVLDFQDAMWGPQPYDLANLLENIRRDVPRGVYDAMLARYGGDDTFRAWFRVMATQFHCRIIGQVLRLAVVSGKYELLQFMPRIQNYIREGLKDPVLKPLADWMKAERVDLTASNFDIEAIRPFIRPDAF
jgi:aminoglycoside/choline kinase family phosphotransferase